MIEATTTKDLATMTSTNPQRTLPRLTALAGAIALTASACGAGTSEIAAETDVVGVAGDFCGAVGELGESIENGESANDQSLAAAAVTELMPADAPDFAQSYFSSIADAARSNASGSDASSAEQAWASGQHLQVASFLGAECADTEAASAASFQGMIAMGMELQASGVDAYQPQADSAAPTTESGSTATTSTDQGSETTGQPSAPGINRVELGESGNSAVYNSTEFVAGPAFATNATRETIFESAQEQSTTNWVVIELLGETLANISTSYPSGLFFLIDPDGRTVSASGLSDRFGESMYDLGFTGRENQSAFALFETPELVSTLEGWQLQVLVGDEIPAFIPLSGASAPPLETVTLGPVDGGTTIGEHYYTNVDCVTNLEIDVASAKVAVEITVDDNLLRSRVGERFLVIEADISNVTDETVHELCDEIGINFDRSGLRINVDGRKSSADRMGSVTVNPGETQTVIAAYTIPRDADEISVLGFIDDDVIATWQVDLPIFPGE